MKDVGKAISLFGPADLERSQLLGDVGLTHSLMALTEQTRSSRRPRHLSQTCAYSYQPKIEILKILRHGDDGEPTRLAPCGFQALATRQGLNVAVGSVLGG
jgi:hypothetical protein